MKTKPANRLGIGILCSVALAVHLLGCAGSSHTGGRLSGHRAREVRLIRATVQRELPLSETFMEPSCRLLYRADWDVLSNECGA